MALIKKQLLAKEDMLLSADNTPVSQARAGTTVSVHPVNASVIPYDENRSIAEAIQGVTYTHPLTHPVSIIDGSSNPSKFVKTDAVGNTGFSDVTWSDVQGKPSSFNPNVHQHSLSDLSDAALKADKTYVDAQLSAKTDISTFTIELAKKADLNIVATGAELQAVVGTLQPLSQKGQANGYVPLDSSGKIPNSYLNSLSTIEVFTANSESNMLLLSNVGVGDQCIRTDLVSNNLFILTQTPATELTNWKQINTSASVFSVNGQTGVVNVSKTDVGLGNVDNTADLLKPLSIATTNALALKANDSTVVHNTGDETISGIKTFSSNIVGNITGNAGTATTLQTARTINGTRFNGSANITTANWGTARTVTIGNTSKSVNGSANVSWSLDEIGAVTRFAFLGEGTDLNTVVDSGFYRLEHNLVNTPGNVNYGQLIVARGGGDTILQIVTGFNNVEIYWRHGNPPDAGGTGSWSQWYRFFHSGNLGDAFTGANQSLSAFGYQRLPGGLIIQWGVASSTSGNVVTVNLPITFPNVALSVACTGYLQPDNVQYIGSAYLVSNSQIIVRAGGVIDASKQFAPTVSGVNPPVAWIAIGY